MTMTITKAVRDYAIETPQTIPVFEKLGIDYCCGGNRPLEEACAAVNLNVDEVLKSLETAVAGPVRPSERELRAGSLAELISHIEKTHMCMCGRRFRRLGPYSRKSTGSMARTIPSWKKFAACCTGWDGN